MKWRVTGALRNGVGRITARENTRGIAGKPSSPQDGPLMTDFAQLKSLAAEAFAPGLADRRDHADLVLLVPTMWSEAMYDEIEQEVIRIVADAQGASVPLILRHSPETDQALTTLQRIDGAEVRAVLGSLRIGAGGLFVEPITLWTEKKPIHLTLDGVVRSKAVPQTAAAVKLEEDADDELEEAEDAEDATEAETVSGVGKLLARVEDVLVAMAESGVGVMRDLGPLRENARELDAAGLVTAAMLLLRLHDELQSFRNSIDRDELVPADSLLRCAYVVRLATECQTVCEAVGA
jgi:hypothetical protein